MFISRHTGVVWYLLKLQCNLIFVGDNFPAAVSGQVLKGSAEGVVSYISTVWCKSKFIVVAS